MQDLSFETYHNLAVRLNKLKSALGELQDVILSPSVWNSYNSIYRGNTVDRILLEIKEYERRLQQVLPELSSADVPTSEIEPW